MLKNNQVVYTWVEGTQEVTEHKYIGKAQGKYHAVLKTSTNTVHLYHIDDIYSKKNHAEIAMENHLKGISI